ncbi:MAG: hypothetical protein K9K30_01635 [Burkholderiaceae bacterium]|nr:hypothetical protein [Sulfuritalea sp.]MCF8173918.1 hypothetical protein [Burkholderiaceae bacterium]MCF8185039.1 hypothetical protein [Polynucleobacter sp.]
MKAKWIRQFAAALLVAVATAVCAQSALGKEDPKARLAKAEAMFQERCKKAGEFIHRTAENVEGVFLMKQRPDHINFGDQYRMDDPYGNDSGGETYIKTFFTGYYRNSSPPPPKGYRYVEALDEKGGQRYRYTGSMKAVRRMDVTAKGVQMALERDPNFDLNIYAYVLDKVPAPGKPPRYGVTYDDISTREERDYWIAGSSLKVIDLQTNEVMAERIGYMMDRGQGNTGGGRSPWLLAARNACPAFRSAPGIPPIQADQTRRFVVRVLQPTPEQ